MTFGYPRVPAGFSLGLGLGRAQARFKNFGLGYPKILEKRFGRARARARAEARSTTSKKSSGKNSWAKKVCIR